MPTGKPLNQEELSIVENFILLAERDDSSDAVALRSNVELLPFHARVGKISSLMGLEKVLPWENPLFSKLNEYQSLLGHYNYGEGIVESISWNGLQMQKWREAVIPICTSEAMRRLASFPNRVPDFIEQALGRPFSIQDQSLIEQLSREDLTDQERSDVVCISVLSSLEFNTQRSSMPYKQQSYLNKIAPLMIQRSPLKSEFESAKESNKGLKAIVASWTQSERFVNASYHYHAKLLGLSGENNNINYDLPLYLVMSVVRSNAPYEQVLIANKCRDISGNEVACDTGSPYNAGVLTTRAFLTKNAGAFNLKRAGNLLRSFTCQTYPLQMEKEPPVEISTLIPSFGTRSGNGFGNGTDCYSCHGQFSKHAQLFVKFDQSGLYQSAATGLQNQDPNVTGGHSTAGLFTSHFSKESVASSEQTEFFGIPVRNLKEAAEVLVKDASFYDCAVKKTIGYYLNVKEKNLAKVPASFYEQITKSITQKFTKPSYADIVTETLTHPRVINAFFEGEGQ